MGGAVGHLYHLYDNPDLTFGEIKEILKTASAGKLEKVSEKLDGLNLVFTWDSSGEGLRAARNSGDIKSGGMDASALAAKFADRGNLSDAFNTAFKVLNQALGSLPPEARTKVFGPDGRYWYSMELIYSSNPNVIQYDGNNVVFHGWPVFKALPDGTVEKGPGGGADVLVKYLNQMQSAVKEKDWKVRGPALVALKKMSDKSIPQRALTKVSAAMSAAKVSDSNSIGDYLENFVREHAQAAGIDPKIAPMVAARVAGRPGAPNLNDIKKKTNPKDVPRLQEYVRSSPKILKAAIAPIESAIHEFAVEVLRGLSSSLISKSDVEVERLRGEVKKAVDAIRSSGDEQAMTSLQTQLHKLGAYDNLATPMEGVVFIHNGNAYKFTGAFAPVNQILGFFKYGRGKPKLASESAIMIKLVKDLIQEAMLIEKGVGDEFELEQNAAREEMEAAQAAVIAWDDNAKKKTAYLARAKELGLSPTGDAARRIKSDPKYGFDHVLASAKRETLEARLEKARRKYAEYDPSAVDFQYDEEPKAEKRPKAEPRPIHYDIASVPKLSWVPWPKNMQKLSKKGYGSAATGKTGEETTGTGPGEEWLAYLFGGTVAGGSKSYDLIMQNDSETWEVKGFASNKGQVRPGTGGRKAISKARDWLVRVFKQARGFFADCEKYHLFKDPGMSMDDIKKLKYARWLLDSEYETAIERGEIPRKRMIKLYTVLKILSDFKKKYGPKTDSTVRFMLGDKSKEFSRSDAINIAKYHLQGALDNFSKPEIVAANLKSPAYDDSKKFISDWYSIVNLDSVFSKVEGGIFIVKPDSFYVIPKADISRALKFKGVSQWVPKIVLASESPDEDEDD